MQLLVAAAPGSASSSPTPSAPVGYPGVTEPTPDPGDIDPYFGTPLSPHLWFMLEDELSLDYQGLSQPSNQLNVRGQIPLGALIPNLPDLTPAPGKLQLVRFKIPFVTSAPADAITGNGDTTLVFARYLGQSKQKWVLGGSWSLPTASTNDLGSGKWCIGPAAGFTYEQKNEVVGLYTQSFFSFAGPSTRPAVAKTDLQPGWTFLLRRGWTVGTSSMTFTYNWEQDQFINVPIGFRVARSVNRGQRQLAAGFEVEKNLVHVEGTQGWVLRLDFKYRYL